MGGKENDVALMLSGHLTNYNDNWKKIELMNNKIFNEDFRFTDPDSSGNPWVFSWHCLDHVGYINNPRKRELGHTKYLIVLKQSKIKKNMEMGILAFSSNVNV